MIIAKCKLQIAKCFCHRARRASAVFPRLRLGLVFGVVCLLAALADGAAAQDEAAEDNPFRTGLIATYSAGGKTLTRLNETVAFDWQDAAPDPRLPAGEFAAVWRGRLWAQAPGRYQLFCFGQGAVEIKLAGAAVLSGQADQPGWLNSQPLELPFDRHELEISYRKTGPLGQLALFWTGPEFRLEPIAERFLLHERGKSPTAEFERGRQLASALRCAACHRDETAKVTPAPALDRLSGNVHQQWLVEWLSSPHAPREEPPAGSAGPVTRSVTATRMPDLAITKPEAEAIAAWLVREPPIKREVKLPEPRTAKGKGKKKKNDDDEPPPSAAAGERLLLTRGCLACHQFGELGESGLFGGGDLTKLAEKRPADFLLRWLSDPAAINRSHRMPVFTFTTDELRSLDLWWKECGAKVARASRSIPEQLVAGEKLVTSLRCANCHVVRRNGYQLAAAFQPQLTAKSDWSRSCGGEGDRAKLRPGYRLAAEDQAAVKAYYSQPRPGEQKSSPQARGRDLLVELNCLACHQREGVDRRANSLPARLQDKLVGVAEAHGELTPLVPAMTPPALNGVGDKLLDAALADSIRRQGPPHRPYLLVQMPKFALSDAQLVELTAYFTATDRIPVGNALRGVPAAGDEPRPLVAALSAAGPRLVTADGLSCTSCHQIGSVPPVKTPLAARGPDISMPQKRIRREWFDRWCDNPARIVPRMEMPAVKIPVRGVLNDNVTDQLAAVWQILNTPGFEPPEPNPVRVLRLSGIPERNERPIVIHDVVKDGDKTYLFPLVIGLPNRHNVLFDLETNRLAAWWLGDTARQRTKGKSWYWEMGARPIFQPEFDGSEISLVVGGRERQAQKSGQFLATLDRYGHANRTAASEGVPETTESVHARYRLALGEQGSKAAPSEDTLSFDVDQSWLNATSGGAMDGFQIERWLVVRGHGDVDSIRLRLVGSELARKCEWDELKQRFKLPGPGGLRIEAVGTKWTGDGVVSMNVTKRQGPAWEAAFCIRYGTTLPADMFPADLPPATNAERNSLPIAPGISGTVLPLPTEIMPSAFAWKADGNMVLGTLKGEVFQTQDISGDGHEDNLTCVADGLATPYGIACHSGDILASLKGGVARIRNFEELTTVEFLATGWGYTDDYHDWAVGLITGDNGEYYVALPCQQDARIEAAAKLRGRFLKLVPSKPTAENPRLFDIEEISAGHRFPMGIARNRAGDIFVTDNQGNYNPFNELNHVRKGAHFGFINALEKEQGFKPPPLAEAAINIPHPWTRSVNGICFLESRVGSAHHNSGEKVGTAHPTFGPLEGHLIGCEYDTRRLIRMSLQKVGDTYQGAAYPFSVPPEDVEKGLLGPIVCAVKPQTGELYVGEIRDSGWGAGNNIGQIVKMKIEPDKLPCGIAEVRATSTGFTIDFLQPVDRAKAADAANYSLESYRRESTPAYGGPDLDRRIEKIAAAVVSADAKRVALTVPQLRAGFVYELKAKNLAPGGGVFHPAEAHYTLRRIP